MMQTFFQRRWTMIRYILAVSLLTLSAPGCTNAGAQEATGMSNPSNLVVNPADVDGTMQNPVASLLAGTTWNVENRTSDGTYSGTGRTGKISFSKSDHTIQVLQGAFAVVGMVHADGRDSNDGFCNPASDITFELISDRILYLTSPTQG